MIQLKGANSIEIERLAKEDVILLQRYLTELEYECGEIDGIVGKKTKEAFNKFKVDQHLTNPDEIGATTIKVIEQALKKHRDNEERENLISVLQPKLTEELKVPRVINWMDFNCPVSKYFTIGEVSKFSSERIVLNKEHQNNVILIAKELDKIREEWGKPIGVTSWYRPTAINRRVGGVSNSQHINGSGVDIYPIGSNGLEFEQWLDKRWERALGWGQRKQRGFTHIDLRNQPKKIRWSY